MHHRHRRFRRHPLRNQRLRPIREIVYAHQHHLGAGNLRDLLIAQRRVRIGGVAVPREHREAGAMVAMGEGNTCVIRRRHHGGNAGDDFKRNLLLGQPLGFLTAPAKNVRIAALQPHHVFAGLGAIHHELREFFLRETAIALVVAARNDFRACRREPQQFRIDQHVANDHFRAPEQFRSPQRQQTRVAGARPDQINSPMRFHADSLCKVFSQVNRLCRPRAGAQGCVLLAKV